MIIPEDLNYCHQLTKRRLNSPDPIFTYSERVEEKRYELFVQSLNEFLGKFDLEEYSSWLVEAILDHPYLWGKELKCNRYCFSLYLKNCADYQDGYLKIRFSEVEELLGYFLEFEIPENKVQLNQLTKRRIFWSNQKIYQRKWLDGFGLEPVNLPIPDYCPVISLAEETWGDGGKSLKLLVLTP